MAVVRPYSARALICEGGDGTRHPEDAILCEFVRIWSRELSREYDIFEEPPFESEETRAKRAAELARYKFVVASVDWRRFPLRSERFAIDRQGGDNGIIHMSLVLDHKGENDA